MTIKAKAYLVIKGSRESTYPPPVGRWKASLAAIYQSKEAAMKTGMEVMEIEVELPDDYFVESMPKIVVQVPQTPASVISSTAKVTKGRAPSAAAAVVQK